MRYIQNKIKYLNKLCYRCRLLTNIILCSLKIDSNLLSERIVYIMYYIITKHHQAANTFARFLTANTTHVSEGKMLSRIYNIII